MYRRNYSHASTHDTASHARFPLNCGTLYVEIMRSYSAPPNTSPGRGDNWRVLVQWTRATCDTALVQATSFLLGVVNSTATGQSVGAITCISHEEVPRTTPRRSHARSRTVTHLSVRTYPHSRHAPIGHCPRHFFSPAPQTKYHLQRPRPLLDHVPAPFPISSPRTTTPTSPRISIQ